MPKMPIDVHTHTHVHTHKHVHAHLVRCKAAAHLAVFSSLSLLNRKNGQKCLKMHKNCLASTHHKKTIFFNNNKKCKNYS